jgi:hypothetical protein
MGKGEVAIGERIMDPKILAASALGHLPYRASRRAAAGAARPLAS